MQLWLFVISEHKFKLYVVRMSATIGRNNVLKKIYAVDLSEFGYDTSYLKTQIDINDGKDIFSYGIIVDPISHLVEGFV